MKTKPFLQVFIISILFLSLLGSAAAPSHEFEAAKAQPILVELARQNPNEIVQVIVQKAAGITGAEEKVFALGGQVT